MTEVSDGRNAVTGIPKSLRFSRGPGRDALIVNYSRTLQGIGLVCQSHRDAGCPRLSDKNGRTVAGLHDKSAPRDRGGSGVREDEQECPSCDDGKRLHSYTPAHL